MKSLFVFANPFGLGPSGKAISILNQLFNNLNDTDIYLCGNKHLIEMADPKVKKITLNERDEQEITKTLGEIKGEKYIFSSQNRFAIRAAKTLRLPSAFLDGLAWFWKNIPQEHFDADIIFWLNYPDISSSIPETYKHKVNIVHGITSKKQTGKPKKKDGVVFYIGGCNNPLTPLPDNYIRLLGTVLSSLETGDRKVTIATDPKTLDLLGKFDGLDSRLYSGPHEKFLTLLDSSEKLITNGGQTATMEAVDLKTKVNFHLPINLSQYALIEKVLSVEPSIPALDWKKYSILPENLTHLTEKEAIEIFDRCSRDILVNPNKIKSLQEDLSDLIFNNEVSELNYLKNLGSSGDEDIYKVLKREWRLS